MSAKWRQFIDQTEVTAGQPNPSESLACAHVQRAVRVLAFIDKTKYNRAVSA